MELERVATGREVFARRLATMQARVEPQFLLSTLAQVEALYNRDPRAGDSWCSGIYPYVKNLQIFVCPEAVMYTQQCNPWCSPEKPEDGMVSYLMNYVTQGRPLAAVPAPAELIFLHEGDRRWPGALWAMPLPAGAREPEVPLLHRDQPRVL